ncbi:chitin deacetylase 1 [Sporodiniella umbellata]|nr:chitin deacetylase 1 [Sporodiniella umbellata]
MVSKSFILSAIALAGVNAVTTNYTSSTDPTKITIPQMDQTTSYDPVKECVGYPAPVAINQAEWPTNWATATSNGMNTSAEFQALYKSIDWSQAPNFPVRAHTAAGGLDMSGYDTANDPACWWSSSTCKTPKTKGINADIYACPEPDVWGLTFDDGPNCSHNAFYDYLSTNKLKASMFYIGSNVLNWQYGALRGVKDGHHIAGHTWSHQLMTTLTNQEVLAELYYTSKAIKYVTGITPKYWRPAQGDIDDRVRWIATQLNLTAILWNLDTDDWAAGTTPGITADTVNNNYKDFINMGSNGTFAQSGNIVLSHEINNMTMDFFMKHYDDIKKSYKHVLDVATCMNITQPYIESSVTFPSYDEAVTGQKSSSANNSKGGSTAAAANGNTSTASAKSAGTHLVMNSSVLVMALMSLLALA